MAHDVEHDAAPIGVVEGVHRVEHVARTDVVPDDVGRFAVTGQQPDAGPVTILPAVGEARTGRRRVHAERHREIQQDDGALGDGAVVHADRAAHGDAPGGAQFGLRVQDRDLDVVAPAEEVGDGVELTRQRVPLGVCRVAAGERAAEVAGADGLELVAQLVRTRPGLDDGEGTAGVPDHVGVRCEVHAGVDRARPGLLAEGPRHLGGTDPAIAIPLGSPVTEPDPVHHAVAGEPVVGGRLGGRDGIGPVAQIAAAQGLGQPAGDGQFGRRHLLEHGCEIALQVRIGGHGHDCPLRRARLSPSNLRTPTWVNNK